MENQYLSRKQREFQRWEVGVMFNFGIRTYYPEHADWDRVRMPAIAFKPKELDCRQWVKTARDTGAKYCVLTVKHYDGFTLWPSKTTRYGIQGSMYKLGNGDIVADYVKACRKYGMKVGLYYSLAQWGGADTKQNPSTFIGPMLPAESIDPAKFVGRECSETDCAEENYIDYVIAQLTELLTCYGKIDYLWLDGNCPTTVEFDVKKIKNAIFKLQPGLLLLTDYEWNPDIYRIGKEEFLVPGEIRISPGEYATGSRTTAFWSEDDSNIKSSEVLSRLYRGAVGKGCNLLICAPLSPKGLFDDRDRNALLEMGVRNGHFVFNRAWIKTLAIAGIATAVTVVMILRSIYVDTINTRYIEKLSGGDPVAGQYCSKYIDGLYYTAFGPGLLNFFNDPTLLAVFENETLKFSDDEPIGRFILQIKPRMNGTCEKVIARMYEYRLSPMGDQIVTRTAEVEMVQTVPGEMIFSPSEDSDAIGMEFFEKYGHYFERYMQAAIEMWELEADE